MVIAQAGDAATSLAHLCFRSPLVQVRARKAGALKRLVEMLRERCAGQAAHAIWHLQLGQKDHTRLLIVGGAVPELIAVLQTGDVDAKMNAAGALMLVARGIRAGRDLRAIVHMCFFNGRTRATKR